MPDNEGKILLYQTDDGKVNVDVRFEYETFWPVQNELSKFFGSSLAKNTFEESELDEVSTFRKFRIVQKEGKRKVNRKTRLYILQIQWLMSP
jgi:hypothetical protein